MRWIGVRGAGQFFFNVARPVGFEVSHHSEKARGSVGLAGGITRFKIATQGAFPIINAEDRLKGEVLLCVGLMAMLFPEEGDSGKNLIVIGPLKGLLPELQGLLRGIGSGGGEIIHGLVIDSVSQRFPARPERLLQDIDLKDQFKVNEVAEAGFPRFEECFGPLLDDADKAAPSSVRKLLINQVVLEVTLMPDHPREKIPQSEFALMKETPGLVGPEKAGIALLFELAQAREQAAFAWGHQPIRISLVEEATQPTEKDGLNPVLQGKGQELVPLASQAAHSRGSGWGGFKMENLVTLIRGGMGLKFTVEQFIDHFIGDAPLAVELAVVGQTEGGIDPEGP